MNRIVPITSDVEETAETPMTGGEKKRPSLMLSPWNTKPEDKYPSGSILSNSLNSSITKFTTAFGSSQLSGNNDKFSNFDEASVSMCADDLKQLEEEPLDVILGSKSCVNALITYLNDNQTTFSDASSTKRFEKLTRDSILRYNVTTQCRIYVILKNNGWDGNKYSYNPDFMVPMVLFTSLLTLLRSMYKKYNEEVSKYNMSNKGNLVKSFCPTVLLENLVDLSNDGDPISCGKLEFEGVCMLADISGFTKLAAKYSSEGPTGLDKLHDTTTFFLGQFVEQVYSYEGDVIAFAGDALICVFNVKYEDVRLCCLDAMRCALELKDMEKDPLTVHIALSYGPMSLGRLGGYDNQWIYLLNGPCVSALAPCIDDAHSKEVVMTSEMYDVALGELRQGEKIETEITETLNRKLTGLYVFDNYKSTNLNRFSTFRDSGHLINLCECFVPKPVRESITVFKEIGDLRTVTTMFLKLDSYNKEENIDPVTLQPFFYMAQKALTLSGGFMRQFLIDDKGCVLIGMWGVPSFSHPNNTQLALKCAVDIHNQSAGLGHTCSIGITTGNVYCGTVGSVLRHDYVGMGGSVNLAARYMCKAHGSIMLDEVAYTLLNRENKETLIQGASLIPKGYSEPLASFVYQGGDVCVTNNEELFAFSVVRKEMTSTMETLLENYRITFLNSDNSDEDDANAKSMKMEHLTPLSKVDECLPMNELINVLVIEGEPGMGRSNAATYFRNFALKLKLKVITIQVRHGDETISCGIFKKLFIELVSNKFLKNESNQKQILSQLVSRLIEKNYADVDMDDVVIKLKTFLGLIWADDAISVKNQYTTAGKSDMMDEQGLKYIEEIIFMLLNDFQHVVIVEDAQLFDELSWKKLDSLINIHKIKCFFLLTVHVEPTVQFKSFLSSSKLAPGFTSPNGSVTIGATFDIDTDHDLKQQLLQSFIYNSIVRNDRCKTIRLSALSVSDIEKVLRSTLKANPNPRLVDTVFNISSGNPFWITSIVSFINERGTEEFTKAIEKDGASNPLTALILCRLDMVTPEHVHVGKVASVVGEDFTIDMLEHLLPDVEISKALSELKKSGFIQAVEGDFETFEFQNPLLQTTIYELIPNQAALDIHKKVAMYLEVTHASYLSPFYSRLSYHYGKLAGKRSEALRYTVKSADLVIRHAAYGEGLVYLKLALTMSITKIEFKHLLNIVDLAIKEVEKGGDYGKFKATFVMFAGIKRQSNPELDNYKRLKIEIEEKLQNLAKPKIAPLSPPRDVTASVSPVPALKASPSFSDLNLIPLQDSNPIPLHSPPFPNVELNVPPLGRLDSVPILESLPVDTEARPDRGLKSGTVAQPKLGINQQRSMLVSGWQLSYLGGLDSTEVIPRKICNCNVS